MKLPLTVTFHGMSRSDWIEDDIRKRAAKVETYCPDITSCRVVVTIPHRHHEAGNRFNLRIDLTVPGDEIAVNRESNLHASRKDLGEEEWVKQFEVEGMRKDLKLVIREAFDIARRRLHDYAHKRRLAVKTHEEMPHGRVIEWIPEEHRGAIAAPDGHEIYFHENSVRGAGLKRLHVGANVAFVEERGDKGPQASTVQVARARPQRASA